MSHLPGWLTLFFLFQVARSFQAPFGKKTPGSADLFDVPSMRLSTLPADDFTVLSHPRFPAHQVRIKRSEFCDPTVKVWTGYVDAGAKHLFFYLFESRSQPNTDDVIMWINGGPGCSSSMGLLMELGPCSIDMTNSSSNGTLWNPYSWNTNANIFFLDQPVGVGFSYADYGETVETTEDAAKNVYAFVSIFFDTFKQFQGRRFHISGESYGGRYLPVFAAEIFDQNKYVRASGGVPINLSSVIIGNGITDITTLYPGRYEIECGTAALDTPLQEIKTCVRMKTALPRCQRSMRESCVDRFDAMACRAAVNFCDAELSAPFHATGRNVYDVSKMCLGDNLCYLENSQITSFLNQQPIRDLLGVASSSSNFSACSTLVSQNFNLHLDKYAVPTQYYIANLLERGIRVLIYAGTFDWQCNWRANYAWTQQLDWTGGDEFRSQVMHNWKVPGYNETAGQTRSAHNLTFTNIYGAGHMVPHDKPVEALHMLQQWLAEEELENDLTM